MLLVGISVLHAACCDKNLQDLQGLQGLGILEESSLSRLTSCSCSSCSGWLWNSQHALPWTLVINEATQ